MGNGKQNGGRDPDVDELFERFRKLDGRVRRLEYIGVGLLAATASGNPILLKLIGLIA